MGYTCELIKLISLLFGVSQINQIIYCQGNWFELLLIMTLIFNL